MRQGGLGMGCLAMACALFAWMCMWVQPTASNTIQHRVGMVRTLKGKYMQCRVSPRGAVGGCGRPSMGGARSSSIKLVLAVHKAHHSTDMHYMYMPFTPHPCS